VQLAAWTSVTSPERLFHNAWLGMVQPEGLVVSPPVLERAQCHERRPKSVQLRLVELCTQEPGKPLALRSLPELLEQLLGLTPELFDADPRLPTALSLYISEGRQRQLVRPTLALRHEGVAALPANDAATDGEAAPDSTPATAAGTRYAMLVWDVKPARLDLDTAETQTGDWLETPAVKFDRLLRECRVPIGLLSNGEELRLVYAPLEGASGHISFRIDDMGQSDGRVILDAFLSLLEERRWFGVRMEDRLPALLVESRQRQAEVTTDLARQVFEALEILLAGFQAAADRDEGKNARLYCTLDADEDRVYAGLLTVLLRLVFLLYCEDNKLMPEHELFGEHYSVFKLFDELGRDNDRTPDSAGQRFGAYGRLIALFRLVYLGGHHRGAAGEGTRFDMPERRGDLFDPSEYPFLEGWGPGGSAPVTCADRRRDVRVPSVDDGTVHRVLEKLIVFEGQRLSYRSLRVEQIGSVYEALMGFAVRRLDGEAVRLRLGGSGLVRLWLEPQALLAVPSGRRAKWLSDEHGFDNSQARRIVTALGDARTPALALERLQAIGGRDGARALAGTLVLQPSLERRRTSSHYTPPELAKSVVERALAPLVKTMGLAPKSSSLLNLVVCDPAMGSGAFLVAACEYLAAQVVAAWAREGQQDGNSQESAFLRAKRLVAQRCLLGVDKNRYAVQLARISLWLATLSRHEPFTFVDHALRPGDSLVGLSLEQIRAFHWKPEAQLAFIDVVLERGVDEALDKRRRILQLALRSDTPTREKQQLLFQARDALGDLQLIADVLVGAFFAHERDRNREDERLRRRDVVERWLSAEEDAGDGAVSTTGGGKSALRAQLEEYQRELRQTQAPFHWMLEYPEVFCDERADPLDEDRPNGEAWVDAFVGNPPFMSGSSVAQNAGSSYTNWITAALRDSDGRADLSAHFFRRCGQLVGAHGTIGFVATNTISQGDTRRSGLCELLKDGWVIYDATSSMPWPNGAAVVVSLVHVALGRPAHEVQGAARLNGQSVAVVNSRLAGAPERSDPVELRANILVMHAGTRTYGDGFIIDEAEKAALILADPGNARILRPFLGGQEINSSPTHSYKRWVIDFGDATLDEANEYPLLLDIVRVRVKRYRDELGTMPLARNLKKYWWRFYSQREELRAAVAPLTHCLVNSQVSKHLVFALVPKDWVVSHTSYVCALERHTAFGVLQSRVHEPWARELSSSMKTDLRYAASDCFATFPFPQPNPRTVFPALEAIGKTLYEARAKYMVDTDQGLTKTYNALKDPGCNNPRILTLRDLHEELDRAVLDAYGWRDVPVPPYCATNDAERGQLQAFQDDVIDRLFVLNAERAAQEAASAPQTPRGRRRRDPAAPTLPGTEASENQTPPAAPRPLARTRPGRSVAATAAAANDTRCPSAMSYDSGGSATPGKSPPSSRRCKAPSSDPPSPKRAARGGRGGSRS
jgi:hypothetical protein